MFEIGSVGFSFGEKPVICGGKYPNGLKNTSCHMYVRDPKFKIKPWHKWETLNTTFWLNKNRTDASVIQIDTYKALIIGGYGDSPDEEGLWANFGQGAPEVGPIPGAPEKSMTFTMDEVTME